MSVEGAPRHKIKPGPSGLVQGGLGGSECQSLESGQEEVFARAEVESGRIEHHDNAETLLSPREVKASSPSAASVDGRETD